MRCGFCTRLREAVTASLRVVALLIVGLRAIAHGLLVDLCGTG